MQTGPYDERYFKEYDFERQYPYFYNTAATLNTHLRPKKILDVGCASGYFVYAFQKHGVTAFGVDGSEYALANSPVKECVGLVDVVNDPLPYENGAFDLVTVLECLEHLPDAGNVLDEIHRVLKPGGYVYVTSPSKYGRHAKADPTHINIHGRREWKKIFRRHAFIVDDRMLVKIEGDLPVGEIGQKLPGFIRKNRLMRFAVVNVGCKFLLRRE